MKPKQTDQSCRGQLDGHYGRLSPRPFMPFLWASAALHSMTPTAKGYGWSGTRRAMGMPSANCGSPCTGTMTPCRNRSAPPSTWQEEEEEVVVEERAGQHHSAQVVQVCNWGRQSCQVQEIHSNTFLRRTAVTRLTLEETSE